VEIGAEFLEQRARSLATVLLTRDSRATVMIPHNDTGYDLEVHLSSNGGFSGRMFAVELKARRSISEIGSRRDHTHIRLNKPLQLALTKHVNQLQDLPFPLLYLIFAMDTDYAYFGWLREPGAGKRLQTPPVTIAERWSHDTHVKITAKVDTWYERRGPR
jgi:hypothetical protein